MKKQNHSTFILVPSEIFRKFVVLIPIIGKKGSSVVFLIFQGEDVGYIDGKTDSLHFASEFLSETSKWVKSLYLPL